MKKFTLKTKKVMALSGTAIVCVGVLCTVLFQQNANAAAANAVTHKNTSSVTSTVSTVLVPPIHKNTALSTAKAESTWVPSSSENKTSSLAPFAPKTTPPDTKPKISGDSVNGKQPTNDALTDKAQKPSYPPKDTTPKKDDPQPKNDGGTNNDPIFGGKVITEQGGNQQTTVGNAGDTLTGDKVGIMD